MMVVKTLKSCQRFRSNLLRENELLESNHTLIYDFKFQYSFINHSNAINICYVPNMSALNRFQY